MKRLIIILFPIVLSACTTTPNVVDTSVGCQASPKATCSRMDLRGADLSGADLSGAQFIESDLTGATLRDARLSGAAMRGAQLYGADLRGADLTGADLTDAVFDAATQWPEGFNPESSGAIDTDGGRIRGVPKIHEPYKTEPIIDR